VTKLYQKERLTMIMEILQRDTKVSVESLAGILKVSGTTVRSDLRELEVRNMIMRTHGGAMLKGSVEEALQQDRDPSYESRIKKNVRLKKAIGKAVAALLDDGDSMMLDDGSTTLQVARSLPAGKRFHVITNGVNICLELLGNPDVDMVATGGSLNRVDLSFYGSVAEGTTSRFFANKAILGASGISLSHGITAPDQEKADLKKAMIAHARELIIVADHTKLDRVTLVPVCGIEKVHRIVTDNQAPAEMITRLRESGVEVILADAGIDGT
jgi:DeoR family transcriptional regulator, fructose operon transcriptional repressor